MEEALMNGQWIGNATGGDGTGKLIVNIDNHGSHYEGVAFIHDDDPSMPISVARIQTKDLSNDFEFRAEIHPIDPDSEQPVNWELLKERYPSVDGFSRYADVKGSVKADALTVSWMTNLEIGGHAVLPRSQADQLSQLTAQEKSWDDFKAYVPTLQDRRRFLFRGQEEPWKLRTSFHRTGRANVARFVADDILALHKHLSARTKHVFNFGNPEETGAFYNLVQHHGYPTPLLDWTYSPYVAAFFAYRRLSNSKAEAAEPDGKVRIHILDRSAWLRDQPQPLFVNSVRLFVSVAEFLAIENERMVPQQAASTLTNVDDIESFMKRSEAEKGTCYLQAIDLAKCDRRRVMNELAYMGITAGSLFPGLDGACEELTERNFEL
jgi:hypothetical protein